MGKLCLTGPSDMGWHGLQLIAECPQRYAFSKQQPKHDKYARPEQPAPALARGTLMHLALAQHYLRLTDARDEWEPPVSAIKVMAEWLKASAEAPAVIEAYEAYAQHWRNDALCWGVEGVEVSLETVIKGRYRLTGHVDLILRDPGGRVWGVDHKTTSGSLDTAARVYETSGQFFGYDHMLREKYGSDYAGMLINFIKFAEKKPKSNPNKETKPSFRRSQWYRPASLGAQFEDRVADLYARIEQLEAETKEGKRTHNEWPRAMSELTCHHRYGPCPFLRKCCDG